MENFILIGPHGSGKTNKICSDLLDIPANGNGKILYCAMNPLSICQIKSLLLVRRPDLNKRLVFMTFQDFFNLAIGRSFSGKMKIQQLLSVISSGVDLKIRSAQFDQYIHVIFDQTETIIDAFPHFLDALPSGTTKTISISVESTIVDQISSILASEIQNTKVLTFSPTHVRGNQFTCNIDEIHMTWSNFISFQKSASDFQDVGLYWPKLAIIETSNERYRKSITSTLARLAYRTGLPDTWVYNSPRLPSAPQGLYILTRTQAMGVGFHSCLTIQDIPRNKRDLEEPPTNIRTNDFLQITEVNAAEILATRNRVNYRFYLNGREVFIRNLNLTGNSEEWYVEVKSGPAEMRVNPLLLVAESI